MKTTFKSWKMESPRPSPISKSTTARRQLRSNYPRFRHVYTNFPITQNADAVNVLLLDALNTPSRDQTFVHSQMIKYLKTIPAGTRIAIFTLASRLRMLQGVTSDSSELLAVLK